MEFLGMVGLAQFLPFMPLYVRTLGVTDPGRAAAWSGAIYGAGFLAAGLMSPLWGSLADRWGRKRMTLRATLGSAVALGLMAFASNVQGLLALRVLQGVLGGFVSAAAALAAGLVPEARLGSALGAIQASFVAGLIVGPLLGGIMMDLGGFPLVVGVSAGFLVLGALVVGIVVPPDGPPGSGPSGVAENLRRVFGSPRIIGAAGLHAASQTAFMSVVPVLALLVARFTERSEQVATLTGVVFSLTAAAASIGSYMWGSLSDRWGSVRVLRLCLLGAALAFMPQAWAGAVWSLAAVRVVLGLFAGGINPAVSGIIVRETRPEHRAGVLGVTFSLVLLGNAAGPALGGAAAQAAGLRSPFLAGSLVLLGAWLASLRLFPRGGKP